MLKRLRYVKNERGYSLLYAVLTYLMTPLIRKRAACIIYVSYVVLLVNFVTMLLSFCVVGTLNQGFVEVSGHFLSKQCQFFEKC